MTMATNEVSSQVRSAEELAATVRAFADDIHEIRRPADGERLLLNLGAAQAVLTQIYDDLAQWHWHTNAAERSSVVAGNKIDEPGNPGWRRASLALQEAAQYSRDAAAALDRARTSDEVALWFDEIEIDEER
jgi:hypothetical protein